MEKRLKILFLCAGNTCRSPLAEGLARAHHGERDSLFTSAGLHAGRGEPASEGTLLVAAELGVDLSAHRSRPVSETLLRDVDWVVAMTRAQVGQLRARFPDYRGRLGLLGLPGVDLLATPGARGGEEVVDPFGGDLGAYHRMADQVIRLLAGWRDVFGRRGRDAEGER